MDNAKRCRSFGQTPNITAQCLAVSRGISEILDDPHLIWSFAMDFGVINGDGKRHDFSLEKIRPLFTIFMPAIDFRSKTPSVLPSLEHHAPYLHSVLLSGQIHLPFP